MKEGDSEVQKDLGRAHFQQELNRWFESRGIISDLRSHLRHLMISALQSTQIGLKPTDKTSPKAQALNLIVAEYLFRHGCHYTLSVFTSEEGELEEIFNALGVTASFEEFGRLKVSYFQKGYNSSLIEVLLQIFTENLTKSQVRKTLDSFEVDEGLKLLSENWSGKIVDILLRNANVTSTQVAAIKRAILRVTESEVKRLIVEGHKTQLRMLAEREKRIQEHLRRHEEEIFFRLTEAEKDLNERRDMIDEELIDRQKHLTEMALEWNEKHEEILKLSKYFHNIESENGRLKKEVEKLERTNENLRIEGEAQKRRVEQLQIETGSLAKRLKEVTRSNVALNERIEVLTRKENKEVAASPHSLEENNGKLLEESPLLRPAKTAADNKSNRGIGESERQNAAKVRNNSQWNATEPMKSNFGSGDANRTSPVIDASEDENESSSNSFSCDKIISSCRESIRALEEESNRINRNYLEYKLKFQNVDSDSEISVINSDRSQEKMQSPKVYADVIKEDRYCQTNSPDMNFENMFSVKTPEEAKGPSDNYNQNLIPLKPETRTPTKRQLQNREFFLKSRQLLQELEKQNLKELNAETPTFIDSSCQIYTPSSSEELGNFEDVTECVKKPSKKSAVPTPPKTVSLYENEGSNDEGESPAGRASRKKEVTEVRMNQLSKDDQTCLALLEETRIKTPQESARKLLRQQILQLDSDGDDEMEKSSEEKSNESPKSISNGKVSIRRSLKVMESGEIRTFP